jgi:hypothetical protein
MSDKTNEQLITEARELCEAATEGPWVHEDDDGWIAQPDPEGDVVCDAGNLSGADSTFITQSRTLVPLLAERLGEANTKHQRDLRVIADHVEVVEKVAADRDEAREALAASEARVAELEIQVADSKHCEGCNDMRCAGNEGPDDTAARDAWDARVRREALEEAAEVAAATNCAGVSSEWDAARDACADAIRALMEATDAE